MTDKPKTLPDSKSSEFWGDAEIIKPNLEIKETSKTHTWIQEGVYAICTSCIFSHAMSIDFKNQEVRDGKIVSKQKPLEVIQKIHKHTKTVDKIY